MRRDVGRNEENASQLVLLTSRLCKSNVPAVDGVEGSAKQTDVHRESSEVAPASVPISGGCCKSLFLYLRNWRGCRILSVLVTICHLVRAKLALMELCPKGHSPFGPLSCALL